MDKIIEFKNYTNKNEPYIRNYFMGSEITELKALIREPPIRFIISVKYENIISFRSQDKSPYINLNPSLLENIRKNVYGEVSPLLLEKCLLTTDSVQQEIYFKLFEEQINEIVCTILKKQL